MDGEKLEIGIVCGGCFGFSELSATACVRCGADLSLRADPPVLPNIFPAAASGVELAPTTIRTHDVVRLPATPPVVVAASAPPVIAPPDAPTIAPTPNLWCSSLLTQQ